MLSKPLAPADFVRDSAADSIMRLIVKHLEQKLSQRSPYVNNILKVFLQIIWGLTFFENGLAIVDTSSICMDIASADANCPAGPGPSPGPGPRPASPEAMSTHINDVSTIASPFPKKVNPQLQNPLEDTS